MAKSGEIKIPLSPEEILKHKQVYSNFISFIRYDNPQVAEVFRTHGFNLLNDIFETYTESINDDIMEYGVKALKPDTKNNLEDELKNFQDYLIKHQPDEYNDYVVSSYIRDIYKLRILNGIKPLIDKNNQDIGDTYKFGHNYDCYCVDDVNMRNNFLVKILKN